MRMNLSEPPPSSGDIHFRLFGIPIRIHPFFWLVTIVLGVQEDTRLEELLLWTAIVLVSIIVHELGHAFVQRRFGGRPRITLHGLGGLAACDDCDRRPSSQIIISLAGPAAGFVLAAVLLAAVRLSGHDVGVVRDDGPTFGLPLLGVVIAWEPFASWLANVAVFQALWVNIGWGLVNLLPIYPLDGGRVARELFTLGDDPRTGIVRSLCLSVGAAALMALFGLLVWKSIFTAVMFGYLAFTSYKTLEAYQYRGW
jgi:Zn-dependent protease